MKLIFWTQLIGIIIVIGGPWFGSEDVMHKIAASSSFIWFMPGMIWILNERYGKQP